MLGDVRKSWRRVRRRRVRRRRARRRRARRRRRRWWWPSQSKRKVEARENKGRGEIVTLKIVVIMVLKRMSKDSMQEFG